MEILQSKLGHFYQQLNPKRSKFCSLRIQRDPQDLSSTSDWRKNNNTIISFSVYPRLYDVFDTVSDNYSSTIRKDWKSENFCYAYVGFCLLSRDVIFKPYLVKRMILPPWCNLFTMYDENHYIILRTYQEYAWNEVVTRSLLRHFH